ncbi:hypothetical protein KW484_18735 [Vibrio fluvialis]|nr:hypothetical protein [Vibrio fluvialis]
MELLNKNGAYFFYIAQHLFMDNVALSFSKLTDPNKQGANENLSLKQLTVLANNSGDLKLAHTLKEKFEELLKSCEKFRKLRNKRIAHADLGHAMGPPGQSLLECPLQTFYGHTSSVLPASSPYPNAYYLRQQN